MQTGLGYPMTQAASGDRRASFPSEADTLDSDTGTILGEFITLWNRLSQTGRDAIIGQMRAMSKLNGAPGDRLPAPGPRPGASVIAATG